MLIPGCDRCGQCGCVCGRLPYTVTVEFSGLVNRTHSAYCDLVFSSNFGCGAAGVLTSPGGCQTADSECGASNVGGLTGVLLTSPGHDYARLGRKQPSLTITGSGSGATFTPTLVAVDGSLDAQCRSYQLDGVAVSGGSGYTEGETLAIVADGVTVTPAVAILHVAGRSAPTLTASVAGGSGAAFSVSVASNGDSPETWGVSGVSVTAGGSGYPFAGGEPYYMATLPVSFSTADTTVTAATGTALPVVVEPTTISVFTTGGGSGFAATLTFSATTDAGRDCYTVSGITITDGGVDYQVGDTIALYAGEFDAAEGGSVAYTVDAVDGNGAVTSLSAPTIEVFFGRLTGAIASVTVDTPGAYYATGGSGAPSSVEVTTAGEYYTEDPTASACVADITITAQKCYGTGSHTPATVNATVDSTVGSPTFGQITELSIAGDGGSGYLAWRWVCSHVEDINGTPFVLAAVNPQKLVTLDVTSDFGSGACLRVVPAGDGTVCDPAIPAAYDGLPGPIREVEVVNGGSGYARVGQSGVEVAAVSVAVVQLPGSSGTGAAVSVTIDSSQSSPTFGRITGATVSSQGSGYTILGAPRDCRYVATPCDIEGVGIVGVELLMRGSGLPPWLVLTDTRAAEAIEVVLEADEWLADCDSLPATATLLYGAPSGVTATIAAGGTVETPCDPPAWCQPACVCPLDSIEDLGSTPISFSSDCGECEVGSISGGGTIDDPESDCVEGGVAIAPAITVFCCDSDCNATGECENKINVVFEMYIPTGNPNPLLAYAVGRGESGCADDLSVVDGALTGTVTIHLTEPNGSTELIDCNVTITFG